MVTLLLPLLLVSVSAFAEGTGNEDCEIFETELHSRPDFSNRVVTSSLPLPPGYVITSMKQDLSKGRSFYWCEMNVKQKKGWKLYRHFGHNSNKYWVTKGCGGWFTIKACRGLHNNDNSVTSGDTVDPHITPTIVTIISDFAQDNKGRQGAPAEKGGYNSLELKDINSGALASLYQWLAEQNTPLHEKLGGSPNRAARSVDEEFAAEFGDN